MPAKQSMRVSPDVVTQDLGDGLVLLNLRTGIYWGLNRTGAVIWRGIENHAGVEKICQQLQAEFDGSEENLAGAVGSLLSELAAERLILEPAAPGQASATSAEGAGCRAGRQKKSAAARSARKKTGE